MLTKGCTQGKAIAPRAAASINRTAWPFVPTAGDRPEGRIPRNRFPRSSTYAIGAERVAGLNCSRADVKRPRLGPDGEDQPTCRITPVRPSPGPGQSAASHGRAQTPRSQSRPCPMEVGRARGMRGVVAVMGFGLGVGGSGDCMRCRSVPVDRSLRCGSLSRVVPMLPRQATQATRTETGGLIQRWSGLTGSP